MKNIHILTTDKPSKKGDVVVWNGLKIWNGIGEPPHHNQNIYITSDEEIKEGDWYLNTLKNTFDKCEDIISQKNINLSSWLKKIILTTDQSLNGVQAIDDEFLEWFVKNPSCKEVEVKHYNNQCSGECGICDNTCGDWHKIIIPQEEPKQETLEEVAEKLYPLNDGFQVMDIDISEELQLAFINGAKWQQEQDKNKYSESDMNEFAMYILKHNVITPKEWFNKFKNK